MKRRTFLHHAAHAMALPGVLGSFGFSPGKQAYFQQLLRKAATENKVLVLIYLQGGNDGLNTVVPLDQLSKLNAVRPHVILPENKLLSLAGWPGVALHPSLTGLREMYADGKLEIIQSVGYPNQNFSHFRSTDIWMSGSSATELVASGWTGRYLDSLHPAYPENYPNETNKDPLSIEMGYGASLLFQGPEASMSTVIKDPTQFYGLINNTEESVPDTKAGDKLKHVRLIAKQSQLYGQTIRTAALKVAQQQQYPDDNDLAQQLKVVARLIAGGLTTPLYLVNINGFDTHDAQVLASDHTTGEHAELLKQLNDAIVAFTNDLEFLGVDDQVVGMTFSEFGRRIVSNASLGTDHGAAAPMFVFGNKVRGGLLGTNPIIPANATYEDNLDIQFDFRQVYASVLEQWFGASSSSISNVLLGNFETVPVIGDSIVAGVENPYKEAFHVYPNPVRDGATIHFLSNGQSTRIELLTVEGRTCFVIYSGKPTHGLTKIAWNPTGLSSGTYLIRLESAGVKLIQRVIKI